jgi:hypothetical protein
MLQFFKILSLSPYIIRQVTSGRPRPAGAALACVPTLQAHHCLAPPPRSPSSDGRPQPAGASLSRIIAAKAHTSGRRRPANFPLVILLLGGG